MPDRGTLVRAWFLPTLSGVVAPHFLIGVWGVFVASFWLPLWRWAWRTHGVKLRELPVDPTPLFDFVVGVLVGLLLAYLVVRVARGPFLHRWLLVSVAFAASLLYFSSPVDWSALQFVLLSPLFLGFGICTTLAALYLSRSDRDVHVP